MKYTNYYSSLLKSRGIPHLSVANQQLIMNIVYLEGGISQLHKLECSEVTHAAKSKALFKLEGQLKKLTANQIPEVLFKKIME